MKKTHSDQSDQNQSGSRLPEDDRDEAASKDYYYDDSTGYEKYDSQVEEDDEQEA